MTVAIISAVALGVLVQARTEVKAARLERAVAVNQTVIWSIVQARTREVQNDWNRYGITLKDQYQTYDPMVDPGSAWPCPADELQQFSGTDVFYCSRLLKPRFTLNLSIKNKTYPVIEVPVAIAWRVGTQGALRTDFASILVNTDMEQQPVGVGWVVYNHQWCRWENHGCVQEG